MVVVPIPFPQGLPALLSWTEDPWTREQAPLQSAQKREINKSPRPAAHQNHKPQQSWAGKVSTGGNSGLFPCPEICFEARMFCQHWLQIPSPTRPYSVFWRDFSKHISNVAGQDYSCSAGGKTEAESQKLEVRCKPPPGLSPRQSGAL